jgi:hypothetical protein
MIRKLLIAVLLSLLLAFNIASCGKAASNGLMKDASPDTSALLLYYYDGENINCSYMFDTGAAKKILGELDAVKVNEAEDWSLGDITLPIYGLYITATDGSGIFASWSNNYWISQDGTVVTFNFDFKKLREEYPWTDEGAFTSFSMFPNARLMTQDENGWNNTLLSASEEPDAPGGVTMELDSWDSDTVSVIISNKNDTEWMYGEHYTLQVLLDDVWYDIPPTPGNWGFNDIGLIVQPGEEQEKTYSLAMYGKIPPGTYRLVAYGLTVENLI